MRYSFDTSNIPTLLNDDCVNNIGLVKKLEYSRPIMAGNSDNTFIRITEAAAPCIVSSINSNIGYKSERQKPKIPLYTFYGMHITRH